MLRRRRNFDQRERSLSHEDPVTDGVLRTYRTLEVNAQRQAERTRMLALAMEEQRGQEAGCWAVFHKDLAVMLGDMRNARGVLGELHEHTWESADRSPEAMCEAMRWSEDEGEKFL